jgi:hypothetical protein
MDQMQNFLINIIGGCYATFESNGTLTQCMQIPPYKSITDKVLKFYLYSNITIFTEEDLNRINSPLLDVCAQHTQRIQHANKINTGLQQRQDKPNIITSMFGLFINEFITWSDISRYIALTASCEINSPTCIDYYAQQLKPPDKIWRVCISVACRSSSLVTLKHILSKLDYEEWSINQAKYIFESDQMDVIRYICDSFKFDRTEFAAFFPYSLKNLEIAKWFYSKQMFPITTICVSPNIIKINTVARYYMELMGFASLIHRNTISLDVLPWLCSISHSVQYFTKDMVFD